jgi:hypothetical protein
MSKEEETTQEEPVEAPAVEVVEEPVDDRTEEGVLIGASTITLPGQKYPTPSPGNGDRVFYETLLNQSPDSHMAQEWCVSYGVLEESKAKKLLAIIMQRKGSSFSISKSPVKAAAPAPAKKAAATKKTPTKAAPVKKKATSAKDTKKTPTKKAASKK